MLGGGTRLVTTIHKIKPVCLDVTRLLRRAGRVHTGIDRVELAYLRWSIGLDRTVFALARTKLGYVVLDKNGMCRMFDSINSQNWSEADAVSRALLRTAPAQARAETALRKWSVLRCAPWKLAQSLRKMFPNGCLYLNTGHSNLTERVLKAFRACAHTQVGVLLHDTIPLDFPEFQKLGTVEPFRQKLARAGRYATCIICNSAQTQSDVIHHLTKLGLLPPKTIVAHLGLDVPPEPPSYAHPGLTDPYVLCLGTIEPRKNHAILLEAWENWPASQARPTLVICGHRGWNNDAVFAQLDALKQRNGGVLEINDLDDAKMFGLMKGARALLFPSLAEGYGLPALEAAALGCPVVCGDLAIYRELLDDLPVYVEESNAYSWQRAIHKVLQKDGTLAAEESSKSQHFPPPTWDDHFDIVSNEMV